MNINITLLGQMITFGIFVWFTMRFVWPPLIKAMTERQERIAEGLAAAERGVNDLQLAQQKAADYLREAKQQALGVVENAHKQATLLIEDAKRDARTEGERLIMVARGDIQQEVEAAKLQLRKQVAEIAMLGAEKILERNLDENINRELVEKLITEL